MKDSRIKRLVRLDSPLVEELVSLISREQCVATQGEMCREAGQFLAETLGKLTGYETRQAIWDEDVDAAQIKEIEALRFVVSSCTDTSVILYEFEEDGKLSCAYQPCAKGWNHDLSDDERDSYEDIARRKALVKLKVLEEEQTRKWTFHIRRIEGPTRTVKIVGVGWGMDPQS